MHHRYSTAEPSASTLPLRSSGSLRLAHISASARACGSLALLVMVGFVGACNEDSGITGLDEAAFNEPAGYTFHDERGFNSFAQNINDVAGAEGWRPEEWEGAGTVEVIQDPLAPLSPSNAIRILFAQGRTGGAAWGPSRSRAACRA